MQVLQQLHGPSILGSAARRNNKWPERLAALKESHSVPASACRGRLTLIRASEGCSMLGGSCQHNSGPDRVDSRHGCCESRAQDTRLEVPCTNLTVCLPKLVVTGEDEVICFGLSERKSLCRNQRGAPCGAQSY